MTALGCSPACTRQYKYGGPAGTLSQSNNHLPNYDILGEPVSCGGGHVLRRLYDSNGNFAFNTWTDDIIYGAACVAPVCNNATLG
jgi:hypothetical protein